MAQLSDFAWIDELQNRLFNGGYLSAKKMTEEGHSLMVDASHSGYISYVVQADGVGYIDYLAVHPSHRHRGLGRALLRGALLKLSECEVVRLTTDQGNNAALHLFESEGFVDQVRLIGTYFRA